MPASSPPAAVGVPFGRYIIRARLGRGGMGEVFLADQLGPLGPVRPVALKRLLPVHSDNAQLVQLFLQEMATAAQLSHPNIAVTYDFGEVDGVYFIAMEYVDGLPLNQLIQGLGPLPLSAGVALGQALGQALKYAHDRQAGGTATPVVHQDVTPHNVLVSRQGQAKLLDFGIAKTEAAVRQGSLRAKVRYAAPEQLRGAPPDRRFDIWGLGVTLYQALTGRLPFPQKDLSARLQASERGHFVALGEAAPHAKPLESLVHNALSPKPDDRFATVEAFMHALEQTHELSADEGQRGLSELVAQVSVAPPHLDGGELTATGAAVAAGPPSLEPSPAPGFADDGPTRITTRTQPIAAPQGPATEHASAQPARRSRSAAIVVLLGLMVGALLVAGIKLSGTPEPAPHVIASTEVKARLQGSELGAASRPPPLESVVVTATPSGPAAPTETTAAPGDAPTDGSPKAQAPAEKAPKATRTRRSKRPQIRRRPTPSKPTPPKDSPQSGLGLLSVRTVPWARVYVDGRALGEGVIARRPIAAGTHRLKLEAGEGEHAPKELAVQIIAGQTTRVFFKFDTQQLKVVVPKQ